MVIIIRSLIWFGAIVFEKSPTLSFGHGWTARLTAVQTSADYYVDSQLFLCESKSFVTNKVDYELVPQFWTLRITENSIIINATLTELRRQN